MAFGFYEDLEEILPHPPIPLSVFLIVEEAFRAAWHLLKSRSPSKIEILTAKEDEITEFFSEILYDEVFAQRLVEGFDREHFTVVGREQKIRNYDGTQLDKMPDLVVGIAGREGVHRLSQDWIFVECKPVDSNHSVGVHYGAKGITRFIKGEYAWAMTEALMIGYVREGYQLDPKLIETLDRRSSEFTVLKTPRVCPRSNAIGSSPPSYITQHCREFVYLETAKTAPPITIRHLWLERE